MTVWEGIGSLLPWVEWFLGFYWPWSWEKKSGAVSWILNLVYLLVLVVFSPWVLWRAVRWGKYRVGYKEKLLGLVPKRPAEEPSPRVWFHAVSVGEVNLLEPLLRRVEERGLGWRCVLSTTTPTGLALARKKYPNVPSFYAPLDFSWAVRRAMARLRPQVLVLVELELWPNLIRTARIAGAKVALINGRLSHRTYRGYRWIRPVIGRLLEQIDLLAVQNAEYAERFLALGARRESVVITGSMKFDGAQTDRSNPATRGLAQLAGIQPEDIVFLAGSTQAPEEAMALETFRRLVEQWPRLRLILVPRHPERFEEVAKLLDQSGLPWIRRTDLEKCLLNPSPPDLFCPATLDARREGTKATSCSDGREGDRGSTVSKVFSKRQEVRILLVDTVGELGAWWGTAQIAFVGGSMGRRGGQNMIEPAAYGAAVCFGPNTHNFRDIVAMLLARQAAVVVHNLEELIGFVRRCLEEPAWAKQLGQRAQALVREQQGATERTFQLLCQLMPTPSEATSPSQ